MKRSLALLSASILVACAAQQTKEQTLVNRAIDALGGADKLAALQSVYAKGTGKQWEPEQSFAPGGEPRHANDATFETVADYGTRSVRTDWVKDFAYPAPRTFKFSEIVTPEAGYVIGREANARNRSGLAATVAASRSLSSRLQPTDCMGSISCTK